MSKKMQKKEKAKKSKSPIATPPKVASMDDKFKIPHNKKGKS